MFEFTTSFYMDTSYIVTVVAIMCAVVFKLIPYYRQWRRDIDELQPRLLLAFQLNLSLVVVLIFIFIILVNFTLKYLELIS